MRDRIKGAINVNYKISSKERGMMRSDLDQTKGEIGAGIMVGFRRNCRILQSLNHEFSRRRNIDNIAT